MTVIELLVAAAMSTVLVGAAGAMVVSAVKTQPEISERTQAISTARFVLERMTREIRNGTAVNEATGARVSFETQVRRTTCGGGVQADATKSAIDCRVTYACTMTTTATCTRTESPIGSTSGTPTTLIGGLADDDVFSYSPSAAEANYIGVTLQIPDSDGEGSLTVSDGAGLRTLGLQG